MKHVGSTLTLVTLALAATGAAPAPFRDKTLVVWAAPANLTQQAGSALTIDNGQSHFDAIVFAELTPRKWMAGSDGFSRTFKDQKAWPEESAEGRTFAQIAIVYQGRKVTIYRNSELYACYTMPNPLRSFGPAAVVVFGQRHLDAGDKENSFTGRIRDARIYDRPLHREAIAALQPGQATGDLKPRAWWSFADEGLREKTGRFTEIRLLGGVRIEDGCLVLGGKGATVISTAHGGAEGKRVSVPKVWSTDGPVPDEVLRSNRLLRERFLADPYRPSYHFCVPEDMGMPGDPNFAESKDLAHWTRLGNEYEFVQDERWYERNGRWDCIWTIPRPGGGLYGYWTATPKKEAGGRFGFGETLDGITWKALAPPKVTGAGEGEVGAIEKIGDQYHMMFGTGGLMVTLVAERPEGPFVAARKNLRLLAGHTYFARFFPAADGVLVNHHSIARDSQVSFGSLKATRLDDEGTLRLAWRKGNEKMKGRAVAVKPPASRVGELPAVDMVETPFDASRGVILEGTLKLPASQAAKPVGLYLAQTNDSGTAILIHAGGVAEFGPMRADGTGFKGEHRVDREWKFGATARFRLLLKGSLVEFYVVDLLMQCYSLPQKAAGRMGLIQAGDANAVTSLKAWQADAPADADAPSASSSPLEFPVKPLTAAKPKTAGFGESFGFSPSPARPASARLPAMHSSKSTGPRAIPGMRNSCVISSTLTRRESNPAAKSPSA